MTVAEKKMRGRPRVFEKEIALQKALNIFWERGYDGASLAELTTELGINKPSLYAAFGNKEELFKQALTQYIEGPAAFVKEAIQAPTARKVAEKFLVDAAKFLTDQHHPKGCMIVQGALSCGQGADMIKDLLIHYRKSYEAILEERLLKAQETGDMPKNANVKDFAKYLATLHQGMSVQAINGATREELNSMIKLALASWPSE
jgi:AcrR family transcriptional regulator